MQTCSTKGCPGLMHIMYCGLDGWKSICPVCRATEDVPGNAVLRVYDHCTAKGYACCKIDQLPYYPEAEKAFWTAAGEADNEEDRLFCLWWSILCRYGIAYTREVTFPTVPARTSNRFTRAFGRFPLPDYRLKDCEAYQLIHRSTSESQMMLIRMLDQLAAVLEQIGEHMQDSNKQYPLFVAWHNRSADDRRCQAYAGKLVSKLRARQMKCFFSDDLSELGILPDFFEAPIYAALASASVMVVVTDDLCAMEEGHMGMEIRRYLTRKKDNDALRVAVCAMEGFSGDSHVLSETQRLSSNCTLDDDFDMIAEKICKLNPKVLLSTDDDHSSEESGLADRQSVQQDIQQKKPNQPVIPVKTIVLAAVLLACLLALMLIWGNKPVSTPPTPVPEATVTTALPETQPPTAASTDAPAVTPTAAPTAVPMTTGPVAAVQEYFRLRSTGSDTEPVLGTSDAFPSFLPEQLADLPLPDPMGSLTASPFYDQDGICLLEVNYAAGPRSVCAWLATEYNSRWQLTGALLPESVGSNMDRDSSIFLLCLNQEITRTLPSKGSRHTYRVIVPCSGRLALIWQSGEKAASGISHTVSLNSGSLTGEEIFSHPLTPSPNRQATSDCFVAPGVYFVSVTAGSNDNVPYSLAMTFTAEEHVELESNNIPSCATPIQTDTDYLASLRTAGDVDFFRFTLEEHSAVNVSFATSGNGKSSTAWIYAVHNAADGRQMTAVSVPGNLELARTGNMYLSPGDYFIQTICGSTHLTNPYTVCVHTSPTDSAEAEPNDTPDTANILSVNQDVTGSYVQAGDIDCFRFILESPALVQPLLTFQTVDSSAKTYAITITGGDGFEYLNEGIRGKESGKRLVPVALPAGEYTLTLTNPSFVRQDYTLRLICQPVSAAEAEPNNTPALAGTLSPGQPCTGVLTTDKDIDCHRLVFDQRTSVRLQFSFQQASSAATGFVLSIVQDGKSLHSWNVKLDSGGLEQLVDFPAGEFCIRVKPSTWWSAPYILSVTPAE